MTNAQKDTSDLATKSEVALKADQSALTALQNTVANKADASTVTELQTAVAGKQNKITFSTSAPTSSDGTNGDVWFVYS